jgi:hypothetical protein
MAAPTISASEIETRALRRADMVGSEFVAAAELTQYCEKAWQEFYGIITTKEPDLVIKTQAVSLAAGDTSKDLAADFKALRAIRHNNSYSLRRAEFGDIERLDYNSRRGKPTHYWLSGIHTAAQNWRPLPTPDAAYSLTVYYIPSISLADVAAGGLNILAGWDEYVVLTAAIKMKDKEESDVSVLMAERKMLLEHLLAQVSTPDVGEPPRMNTFSNPFVDPFDVEDRYGP